MNTVKQKPITNGTRRRIEKSRPRKYKSMTKQISLMVLASNTGIGRRRESYWHYNEKCVLISTPCRRLLSTLRIRSVTDLINDNFSLFQCSRK